MSIAEDIQGYSLGKLIELFEINLSPIGIPTTYYFSPYVDGSDPVLHGGNYYQLLQIEAEGFEWSTERAFPRPTIRVSNVEGFFSGINIDTNNLMGATVKRTVTLSAYVDTGSSPDTADYIQQDLYKIDRKSVENKEIVEYELATFIDQEGARLPKRTFNKDVCSHSYRKWEQKSWDSVGKFNYDKVSCPYTGELSYDEEGGIVPAFRDKCSKRLTTGCQARFGSNLTARQGGLPMRAFPSMTEYKRT